MIVYKSSGTYYHKSGHIIHKHVNDGITVQGSYEALHRLDGPAFESPYGDHAWWINNIHFTNFKDFQAAGNLTDDQMTILKLKYGDIK
jgi:hypothetical protein